MDLHVDSAGLFRFNGTHFHAAVGRGGVKRDKREGDGASPVGCFTLKTVFFRPDKLTGIETALKTQALKPDMGWCDDPDHKDYNRLVTLPHPASCERLWRDDDIYDVFVVLGHNDDPPEPGLGSAIFLHVARPGFEGTDGCIALRLADLLTVLKICAPGDRLCIARKSSSS